MWRWVLFVGLMAGTLGGCLRDRHFGRKRLIGRVAHRHIIGPDHRFPVAGVSVQAMASNTYGSSAPCDAVDDVLRRQASGVIRREALSSSGEMRGSQVPCVRTRAITEGRSSAEFKLDGEKAAIEAAFKEGPLKENPPPVMPMRRVS